ncbi:hypothetical protein LBMAG42_24270 [Deltaproteobacteria bacterium]|nr:hypothetical protein LBMAG42_24270 [Deltaproteobacteria bacterium]
MPAIGATSWNRWGSTWAAGACALYLALAFGVRGGVPFVRFPAFAFPDTGGVMAMPLFLANGEPAEVTDFTDFMGVGPEAVDVVHTGLPSVVSHRFYEAQSWIGEHPGERAGDVEIAVGLRVLRVLPDGSVAREDRVDGRGTARRRKP